MAPIDFITPEDSFTNKILKVPPVGAEVPSIPTEGKVISIDGQTVYYEKVMDGDKVTYKVIGVGN